MRFSLSLTAALLCGSAAIADDILVRADISDATIYASGAEITRTLRVTIPAGEHRLIVAMPDADAAYLPRISGPDALTLGATRVVRDMRLETGALDTPAEAEARARVEAARAALLAAEDDIDAQENAIRAIETQQSFLSALASGGATLPDDPALIPDFLSTLGRETARLQGELQAANIARRAQADIVTDREEDLDRALDDLAELQPFEDSVDAMAVPVSAEAETEAELTLTYISDGASWRPVYDLHLDTEAERLEVARFITVSLDGKARWQDVAVTFSTANSFRRRTPSQVFPSPARIEEPSPLPRPAGGLIRQDTEFAMPAPAVDAMVIGEDRAAIMQVQGLSVTYVYQSPVSLSTGVETTLPFDALTFDVDTEARAVPRRDTTAFLMTMFENVSDEPILPGRAVFFRDGDLIGEDALPLIPVGAETEMAFGPLDHLQMIWIDRSLAEGDRGVFMTSNTQERAIGFGVENLSGEAAPVRLYYATPFAEQEDLDLDVSLSRTPDVRNADDRRGVHVWDLDVPPGGTEMVEMDVTLSWPEGMILNWQP